MHARELAVADAYEFIPSTFTDERGLFVAPFQEEAFRHTVGHPLRVAQANHSRSRAGVIRGIHFSDTPPGQAKYVYCPRGALLDVVVDVRVGSPTFGACASVRLDAESCHAVYIAEGLGHGFRALVDDTVLAYLCSSAYDPDTERGINPLEDTLGLPWPTQTQAVLSAKDRDAPTLDEAARRGLLPRYADCLARYEQLRAQG